VTFEQSTPTGLYSPTQWQAIDILGQKVDQRLDQLGVDLTMGGEPTYIDAADPTALEWTYGALGEGKRQRAETLLLSLQRRLTPPGSLRHYGLGKLYPGEPIPRWALGCFWRLDGEPLWRSPSLLAAPGQNHHHSWQQAQAFITELLCCLGIPEAAVLTAQDAGVNHPTGYVLPFLTVLHQGKPIWSSCRWTVWDELGHVPLVPGEMPVGMRLPLGEIPQPEAFATEALPKLTDAAIRPAAIAPLAAPDSIQLALCIEVRQGVLHIFLPPIASARSFVDLLTALEATAESLDLPVVIEGYAPPFNQGIQGFQLTPDPGVLEVNIHPVATWSELVELHTALDDEAFACGLTCERYGLDGRPLGTGGGAHITIGGATPATSPLLQRPDLLRSLITYWQHHPSLTYLFSGQFVGPTSQSPRVDEARHDNLYELEVAFLRLTPGATVSPELLDHLLSPFLADITGNTHRTALCIDKLFPRNNPPLQLGLLEFRSFEMPTHPELRLLQMLLIRALVAWFWQTPFTQPLQRWGPALGDRYLLPHYLQQDFETVLHQLGQAGFAFSVDWFTPFWQHRFPRYGQISLIDNPARSLEVRAALEPWPVIGDLSNAGASRRVDNSLERLQVRLTGAVGDAPAAGQLATRYGVLCNGHRVPMCSTGIPGDYVGGIRFRARAPVGLSHPELDHPTLAPHGPLTLVVIDTWQQRIVGSAVYHVQAPDGSLYGQTPITPAAAQARMGERFNSRFNLPPFGEMPPLINHPEAPLTLDLRLANQRA
jgi:uncharacterized protein (DUF2126 family)